MAAHLAKNWFVSWWGNLAGALLCAVLLGWQTELVPSVVHTTTVRALQARQLGARQLITLNADVRAASPR